MADIIEIHPHDRVLLITILKKSLNETSTSEMVDEVMTAAAERPGVPVILDFGPVKFAPSVALGSLMQLSKSLTLEGRRMALINLDQRIYGAIRVARLHTVLEIHDTLDRALQSA